jgi:hypothetical protein
MYRPACKIEVHPIEFFNHIAQTFNGVVGESILKVKSSSLNIQFQKYELSGPKTPLNLFKELAISFTKIKEKYLKSADLSLHVRLKFEEDESYYRIKLIGYEKVPPNKILKLCDLIIWYYIVYISGSKPSESVYGKDLIQKWKNDKKYFESTVLKYANRRIEFTSRAKSCYICGESTNFVNNWTFFYRKENRYIDMITRVCKKHRGKIL